MLTTIFFIIILFYSIIFHEVAHGYAAYRNGDNTAYNAGRITLNPISHIDMIGSIIVPIFSYLLFNLPFGWAKPVPYNPNNLKNKYGELAVSSAGILANFLLAFFSVIIFYILKSVGLLTQDIFFILSSITTVNIFLALFNLLPFPPADGFSVFSELFLYLQNLYLKIKSVFTSKRHYRAEYIGGENKMRNKFFYIKHLFSNPILMIVIIIVAVNVFKILVPYILSFIELLYSF